MNWFLFLFFFGGHLVEAQKTVNTLSSNQVDMANVLVEVT